MDNSWSDKDSKKQNRATWNYKDTCKGNKSDLGISIEDEDNISDIIIPKQRK